MNAAVIGLIGLFLGLAAGRFYSYWATRRSELADAVTATAALGEELRRLIEVPGDPTRRERLLETWTHDRRSLLIFMSPDDATIFSDSIAAAVGRGQRPGDLEGLLRQLTRLHEIFWEDHEAFILVPPMHYLAGITVSKRIRKTLADERTVATHSGFGPRGLERWHRPPRLDRTTERP